MARGGRTARLGTACPLLIVVLALAAGGCGSTTRTITTTITNPPGSSPPTAHPVSAPTCSQVCLQAGPEGGPNGAGCQKPDGQPYSTTSPDGCLRCPAAAGRCLDILSTQAAAQNGIVDVRVRCNVSTPCDGALLLLQPNHETTPQAAPVPPDQRVAGSDIHVPANGTSDVPVKLTALGQRLVQSPGGYRSVVWVQLEVYGAVNLGSAAGTYQPRMLTVHA